MHICIISFLRPFSMFKKALDVEKDNSSMLVSRDVLVAFSKYEVKLGFKNYLN